MHCHQTCHGSCDFKALACITFQSRLSDDAVHIVFFNGFFYAYVCCCGPSTHIHSLPLSSTLFHSLLPLFFSTHRYGWFHAYAAAFPPDLQNRLIMNRNFTATATGLSKLPYLRDTRRAIGLEGYRFSHSDEIGLNGSKIGMFFFYRTSSYTKNTSFRSFGPLEKVETIMLGSSWEEDRRVHIKLKHELTACLTD
jgi:hypothetical protein